MKYSSAQSGFSLVETLVALSLLLIVIVGPMTIVTSSARSTAYATEQVTAFFLAQEGAEIVQQIRDDLILGGYAGTYATPWDSFVDNNVGGRLYQCYQPNGCGLFPVDGGANGEISAAYPCGSGSRCQLYYNPDGGRSTFLHTNVDPSPYASAGFTRVIKLTPTSPGEIRVVSSVSWRSGNFRSTQTVEVETYLYNVYGN